MNLHFAGKDDYEAFLGEVRRRLDERSLRVIEKPDLAPAAVLMLFLLDRKSVV